MRLDSMGDILCYSGVECIGIGAENVNVGHQEKIPYCPSTHYVRSGPFDSSFALIAGTNLGCAKRSHERALLKGESNGDANGIRTRVTAVTGRCRRPRDDTVV